MGKRNDHSRILIYSHDSFGLGHLRRCRAIAHALVQRDAQMSVLILSGSPIIGSYEFGARVDFVRIPGVIKLSNGEYTSLSLKIDLEETLAMRASIIEHTASIFDPDMLLVDKEPLGLRGEIKGTLELLKDRGTPLVLGLRDVMDEPGQLAPEWERKNVVPALRDLYDSLWVYGLPQICDPLEGIDVPRSVRRKVSYTGYLKRERSGGRLTWSSPFNRPFILVTPGGGGDGEELVDWVLRAYEQGGPLPHPALIVLGPFMQLERQNDFMARAAAVDDVEMITFDSYLEDLMGEAIGVVAMGGYNTFCEILSFDKRAIVVPRERPRREQFMRAKRADDLGLVRMLPVEEIADTGKMVDALISLPDQRRPSEVMIPGLLDGLDRVHTLVGEAIADARASAVAYPQRQTA